MPNKVIHYRTFHHNQYGNNTIQAAMLLALAALALVVLQSMGTNMLGNTKSTIAGLFGNSNSNSGSGDDGLVWSPPTIPPGGGSDAGNGRGGGDNNEQDTGSNNPPQDEPDEDGSSSGPAADPSQSSGRDREREIALLEASIRQTERAARTATLFGRKTEAAQLTAMADALKMDLARIRGADALKTEIVAIAARRSVQATANALLKAIERRVPITRFVTAPILDGTGQLTEEFVKWWRSNQ